MIKRDVKALGCLSLLVGGLLSILIPVFIIGSEIYSDVLWLFLMPGWVIFRPGAHDFFELLSATVFDTLVFAAVTYGIIYGVVRFSNLAKFR